MVAPVTGPFTRVVRTSGGPTNFGWAVDIRSRNQSWRRQRKPFNLRLPYVLSDLRVENTDYRGNPTDYSFCSPFLGAYADALWNIAYEKFRGKLKTDEAALSVSLAERRQALSMIESRALQLYRFTRALKKGRLGDAAAELSLRPTDPRVRKIVNKSRRRNKQKEYSHKGFSKDLSSTYLEFHFGWSPLVMDIGNAVNTLQKGVPPATVKTMTKRLDQTKVVTPLTGPGYGRNSRIIDTISCETKWSVISEVRVTNPNLWLANQLGFVNPALVAWELVPFSFVLDWFVNVSDFLGSFTDMWGISLENPSRTRYQQTLKIMDRVNTASAPGSWKWTGYSVFMDRMPGPIPGPTLRLREPWILSPRRGFAAVSLLVQKGFK